MLGNNKITVEKNKKQRNNRKSQKQQQKLIIWGKKSRNWVNPFLDRPRKMEDNLLKFLEKHKQLKQIQEIEY